VRHTAVVQRSGDAEVHHLDLVRGGEHHVAGLDVAVLQKNVLSLQEVNEQLLLDAVNSVRIPLAERDPEALSDDAPWQWTLSDLETEWQ
jgi:hypothetical protein